MIGELREAATMPTVSVDTRLPQVDKALSCNACGAQEPGPVNGTCRVCGNPLRLRGIIPDVTGVQPAVNVLAGEDAEAELAEGVVSFAKKRWTETLHPRDPGGQGGGQFTRGGGGGGASRPSGARGSGAPRAPRGDAPRTTPASTEGKHREAHGTSARQADAARRVRAARVLGVPHEVEEFTLPTAVTKRLGSMFDREKNAPKRVQPTSDGDELFTKAAEALGGFQEVLDLGQGVTKALGAKVSKSDDAVADPNSTHVIIAPLKGRERSDEKVASKYGGDYSRLGDVVRGTVVVPKLSDLPGAVDAIRSEALKRGWKIHAPENRFAFEEGSHVNTGPLASGYRDAAIQLVSPSGIVTELQINTAPMFAAKADKGHKLYEDERSIIARAQLAGRELTPEEHTKVDALREEAKRLYTKAFADSWRSAKAKAPDRRDVAAAAA